MRVVPPPVMVRWWRASFHVPLPCLSAPPPSANLEEFAAAFAALCGRLGRWLGDVRDLYRQAVPENERRNDLAPLATFDEYASLPTFGPRQASGDLFADHWAPFLSGCLLFHPPEDRLMQFADHVVLDPETLIKGWVGRSADEAAWTVPPGLVQLRDPDAVEASEQDWHTQILARLSLRYEPRGIDLIADMADVSRSLMSERAGDLARLDRIPTLTFVDPRAAKNQEVIKKAASLLAKGRAGRPRIVALEAAQVAALRDEGLTEGEIADRLALGRNPNSYDKLTRSNRVRSRIKRDGELRPRRKNPAG